LQDCRLMIIATFCVYFAGLKFLSIRSCFSVTPEGILSCLRLPSLKRFNFLTKDPVHESFVVQLVSQNPNLEVLSLKLTSEECKDDNPRCTKSILQGISHPRLRTLIDLATQSRRGFLIERRSPNDPDSDSDADDPMETICFLRHLPLPGRRLRLVN